MKPTVLFRDFEERDIDFIYQCKKDERLNTMVVGNWHPFTREEAERWVYGCMGRHDSYKFWAICTNDEEKRIVGWISLANIDYNSKRAHFHGIVIADPLYRDGFAWIESYLFILNYVFNVLSFESVTGSCFISHKHSTLISKALYFKVYEIERGVRVRNGQILDIEKHELYKKDYDIHYSNQDYDIMSIIMRMNRIRKQID